jgi:hypothetical protein
MRALVLLPGQLVRLPHGWAASRDTTMHSFAAISTIPLALHREKGASSGRVDENRGHGHWRQRRRQQRRRKDWHRSGRHLICLIASSLSTRDFALPAHSLQVCSWLRSSRGYREDEDVQSPLVRHVVLATHGAHRGIDAQRTMAHSAGFISSSSGRGRMFTHKRASWFEGGHKVERANGGPTSVAAGTQAAVHHHHHHHREVSIHPPSAKVRDSTVHTRTRICFFVARRVKSTHHRRPGLCACQCRRGGCGGCGCGCGISKLAP